MTDATTTYFASLPDCYVIIEHVPCKKCLQCGDEVFSATVMERIDEILATVARVASKVCITEYKAAA